MFISCLSFAQNKQVLYGFKDLPQSLMLNPGGKVNNDWYFGVPLLSHIHANIGSSELTVYDLFANDNIDFNQKLRQAIYRMQPNDFFTVNQQLEILSGGFAYGDSYEKNKYISFGFYQELDFIGYFPKDYAILAYEGNFNNTSRLFKANHLNFNAEVISVLHVGFNKKVNKDFTYGFRGKLYSSIANINSTNNKGGFVTEPGDDNLLRHVFSLDGGVRSSGLAQMYSDDDPSTEEEDISSLKKNILFGGNMGLGLDIGFTYQLNDQWYWDASLIDIGFISHRKDIENYELKGDYVFEGIDPLFPDNAGRSADEYWTEIEDDFDELFSIDTTSTKYTTMRPIKFNTSLNYSFGKKQEEDCNCIKEDSGYLNAVGAQLYGIARPKGPQLALTTYYYRRLFRGLDIKATYTIDSFSFSNIGAGISANMGGLNIYVMADNFLNFKNLYDAQSVSLQLGINYIFNKNEN
ncbi:hypothetical protein FUA24_21090 [Seonamhaeicola marinus]|uniref:DUF5723 domain-containing protein n=1 Tax=Seonamhaeicola marinus TaxID=1912246 RepID=A0A5D0HFV4_9FLAO|nr:hypothetical protein FUA24_21090 [Seonamhaeicola marinus]